MAYRKDRDLDRVEFDARKVFRHLKVNQGIGKPEA
jgi:hypothetical protein